MALCMAWSQLPNLMYEVKAEPYQHFLDVTNPVLSILVDLGVKAPKKKKKKKNIGSIQRVASPLPDVYAFRVSGFGARVYECVPKDGNDVTIERDLTVVLGHQNLQLSGGEIQDIMSQYNDRFAAHGFDDRCPAQLMSEEAPSSAPTSPEEKDQKDCKAAIDPETQVPKQMAPPHLASRPEKNDSLDGSGTPVPEVNRAHKTKSARKAKGAPQTLKSAPPRKRTTFYHRWMCHLTRNGLDSPWTPTAITCHSRFGYAM